jgi:hypothetical protein
MAHDFRYNQWIDALEPLTITNEVHTIPLSSPYEVRLNEVPQKTDPSSLVVKYTSSGTALTEKAEQPAEGQFWPDYNTSANGDENWNTGTLLFNSADAGKEITVSYKGLGTLVDVARILEIQGCEIFTVSGNWICPKGKTHVNVLLVGGGGGGGGKNSSNGYTRGGDGGNSSFGGTLLVANGGQGALIGTTAAKSGTISTSSTSAFIELASFYAGTGGAGGAMNTDGGNATGYGNSGGNSGLNISKGADGTYCNMNGTAGSSSGVIGSSAGGGALYAVAVPVTAGNTYTITIGAGGIGGDNTYDGGDGSPGICIIW